MAGINTESRLTLDPAYHAYWWDSTIYVPSVTQIIDSNGHTSDFCKSKSHADRGTEIHDLVEIDVKRQIDGRSFVGKTRLRHEYLAYKYKAEWEQFQQFCADFDLEFISSEQRVHGSVQFYQDNGLEYAPDWAGTLDMRAFRRKGHQFYVIDLKTGKRPPASANLQTAAYTISQHPVDFEDVKRMALMLHATRKKYGTKPYDKIEDFAQWKLEVLRYKRNNPSQ